MSVLDLFAAALGAFILIAVILFPDYLKQQNVVLKLEASEKSLNQCQQTTSEKEKSLATCQASLASTFVVIAIEWSAYGNYDVDLHVTDPEGHEFSFSKNNRDRRDYPTSEAQLSYDNTRGPGVELWQHPKATPGTYRISYVYYRAPAPNSPVEVKGNVFYRNGRSEIPPVTLTETLKPRIIANIVVGEQGDIDLRVVP